MIHMLRNYKHNFFWSRIASRLLTGRPQGKGGGGFYSMILKQQRVCNKGSDLAGGEWITHPLKLKREKKTVYKGEERKGEKL